MMILNEESRLVDCVRKSVVIRDTNTIVTTFSSASTYGETRMTPSEARKYAHELLVRANELDPEF